MNRLMITIQAIMSFLVGGSIAIGPMCHSDKEYSSIQLIQTNPIL